MEGYASFNKVLGPAGKDREVGHNEPGLMDTKLKQSDSVSDNKDKGKFEVETDKVSVYIYILWFSFKIILRLIYNNMI